MPAAQADLAAIQRYVGLDNPRAAERLGRRLVQACMALADLPFVGRPGEVADTREITTVRPYVIVYRVARTRVEILRVWHGGQMRA